MPLHFDTRQFLKTLAGVAQGQIQGQMQGQQDYEAHQVQQQQLEQQRQQFEQQRLLDQSRLASAEQERRLEPYKVLAPFAGRFTPGGLANFASDFSAAAGSGPPGSPPAASALGAVRGRPFRAPYNPPTAEPAPSQPGWYQQVQNQTASPTATPAANVSGPSADQGMYLIGMNSPQASAAPETTAAPDEAAAAGNPESNVQTIAVRGPGGRSYEIAGVSDKDRTLLSGRYQRTLPLISKVQPNSPAALIIAKNQPDVNLDPKTPEELAASRKSIMAIEGALTGSGINATSGSKERRAEITADIVGLQGKSGQDLVTSLADVWQRSKDAEKEFGNKGFGFQLRGSTKDLDELARLQQSENPDDQAAAERKAKDIMGRIRYNLTPDKQISALNTFREQMKRYSPFDKQYDAKAADLAKRLKVEDLLPHNADGTLAGGMAGAALETEWDRWRRGLIGLAGKDKKTQRFVLNEGRQLAKLTGRDPSQVPTYVGKELTEKDQILIKRGYQQLDYADKAEARAEALAERQQATFEQQQRKLTNGGQLNAAQTLKGYADQYKIARKATDDYLKGLYASRADIGAGDMLTPEQNKKAQGMVAAEDAALQKANAFFNKAKSNGKPTSTTATTKTRAAVSGPSLERRQAFLRIKRDHPDAKADSINTYLDGKNIH